MRVVSICGLVAALSGVWAGPALAQSRPVVTQDPEPVGSGKVLVDFGVDYSQGDFYPLSGLRGNLTRMGTFDLNFGVSSIADIQLDGGFHDFLSITSMDPTAPLASLLKVNGTSTGDFEDGVIGAKIRLRPETTTQPSLAIRFTTRLPNSKHDSGLGLDTTDFAFAFLLGKTVRSLRLVGNFGWSILQDPVHDGIQNDVVTYGGSIARSVAPQLDLVADINGRWSTRHGTPPVSTETQSTVRVGVRYSRAQLRYDAGVILGVTSFDPNWGVTGGVTWIFKAFTIQ
jgi:hypothetical protein